MDENTETTPLTCSVTGDLAAEIRRIARHVKDEAPEQVMADFLADAFSERMFLYEKLYADADGYAERLEGLARRAALLARDMMELPAHEAARVTARAQQEHVRGLSSSPERYEQQVEKLAELWKTEHTDFSPDPVTGEWKPDGDVTLKVTVSPEVYEELRRLGGGSDPKYVGPVGGWSAARNGAEKAVEAGLSAVESKDAPRGGV